MIELLTEEQKLKGRKINLKKDERLFLENQINNEVFFLINGEIIISSLDENGNEDIYNHFYGGDIFGNNLLFSDKNRYLGDAVALKNSVIYAFSKEIILKIFQENVKFLEAFLKINANETINSKLKIKLLAKRNIKDRIIYFLNINGGEINMSINELAASLIINRVCISRVISNLIAQNIISKKGKLIKLISSQ